MGMYDTLYKAWLFNECEKNENKWKCPCGKIGTTQELKSHYGHIKESRNK